MKFGLSIILGLTMTAMIAACGDSKSGGAAPAATTPAPTDPGVVAPNANKPIDAYGVMEISSKAQYKKFLKDNNVCDTWPWGNSVTCSDHDSFAHLRLVATNSTFPSNGQVAGHAEIGVYNTMFGGKVFEGAIRYGNQIFSTAVNTGFEVRTTGIGNTPSYNSWISIKAENARLTDASAELVVYYQNIEIGRANLVLH